MGKNSIEKLFWSIALPGFGQLLNGRYLKGILLVALEFLINVQANFNTVIMLSFRGDMAAAIEQVNYGWIMFYPCLYFFAMWDAYKDAGGGRSPYSFLPFVFAAYFVTVGIMFSNTKVLGVLWGPIWLPILSVIPGLGVGFLIKMVIIKWGNAK
ncbi:hypothetical protein MUO14_11185 [Halobacillus shinanisalinarum]|uniref:Uncharacterized protein n=1 Tax=Halobacillus shinanisalinarum TaxID=2932258 RepID=A0ABY4H5F5_9BACI|nr:hypothetical protein [Halobacillus shinanisalinarum]UOQ95436.1 hypothetical protein MUO14_11185 [Halobacillus shinanisalinarum]